AVQLVVRQPDAVVVVRQRFAVSLDVDAPLTGPGDLVLEIRAEFGGVDPASPVAAARVHLVTVAALELLLARGDVAESRDVHAGRTAALVITIQVAGVTRRRAATVVVIHQVLAELAAVV